MNGIITTLQLLELELQDQYSKELISQATLSSQNLMTILNDILDFSKIEAGMLSFESVGFSFSRLLSEVSSQFHNEAKRKLIKLYSKFSNDFTDEWVGDPVRVRQVLINLISNAVKFTDKGYVEISVWSQSSPPKDGGVDSSGLHFSIKDTGIGMTEDALDRLFKRFEQADKSTTREFGGTGLGMSITHTLVQLMGGSINVTSSKGVGTTFNVFLPLLEKTQDNSVSSLEIDGERQDSKEALPVFDGKYIVLAEDNKVNQILFKAILNKTGCHFDVVENGQEAIDVVFKKSPDLVLMDIQMPTLDGIEACKIIKEKQPNLPVVAVTANVMEEDIRKYESVGFDDHVGKPIDLKRLYEVLVRILG